MNEAPTTEQRPSAGPAEAERSPGGPPAGPQRALGGIGPRRDLQRESADLQFRLEELRTEHSAAFRESLRNEAGARSRSRELLAEIIAAERDLADLEARLRAAAKAA